MILHIRANGITPAWAGKSSETKTYKIKQKDHPRVGGEKTCEKQSS